ncbi:hypothetical protein FQA39_LY03856 [Lamprigera yunnana]|nr:hypothetical protein FQA39_LY03856 [Lamprigera yunnana]
MQGNQLKRSSKTDFSSTTPTISRERSFIKLNRDSQKRRSQIITPVRGKPTMEIYRPPNVRTDLIQYQSGKLNVHAKEFTMNHELQNSKSTNNMMHSFESIPIQHSKSSGNVLRQIPSVPHGLISILPAPLPFPIIHSATTHALLNQFPRVNFQFANEVVPTQVYHNPVVNFGNWNHNNNVNLKKSKSLGAADAEELAVKLKRSFKEDTDINIFAEEDRKNIGLAIEDPNLLQSRTLMDLVKTIMEKVVEGIQHSENGAKLCMTIIEKEKNQTFVESLINTCQQWFQERDKVLRGIKAGDGTRFTAFMWFLTEMCGQLKRHKHQCHYNNIQPDVVILSILAKCCQACVSLPIKCLTETECLFFVLTSIGRDLENELPSQLEQLLVSVRDAFLATTGVTSVRRTLLQLIELHASNWQLPGSSVLPRQKLCARSNGNFYVIMIDSLPKDKRTVFANGCEEKAWKVVASRAARNCKNYIRDVVDNLVLEPNPEKQVIALSLGDPTVYGNLCPSRETVDAVLEAINSGKCNGYGPTVGSEEAREAVADYLSVDGVEYDYKDVILCSGCSSSLELCITVLADPSKGHNILIPKQGFPIYRTLAESFGVEVRSYNLIPEQNWMIDLSHFEAQIDEKTAAIVINNPSNPCGSVFDEHHLRDILDIAYRHKLPIIADEIYERLVFAQTRFVSLAAVNTHVPILICGGLAKRFLVPGWRMGWILFHDPIGAFDDEIRKGLTCLSQKIIGSNSIVQGALPKILKLTHQSYYDDLNNVLYENARLAYEGLSQIDGLTAFMPSGTMYMMVKIQLENFSKFSNGLEFMQRLMEEESVFCLPGECFGIPGFMRLVITIPSQLIKEACDRMNEFCKRYYER